MRIKEIKKLENIINELGNVAGKRFVITCIETEIVKFKHPCHTVSYLCSEFIDTEYEVKIEYFKNKELKTSHWIGQDNGIIHDLAKVMEKQYNIEFFENGLNHHWNNSIKRNVDRLNDKNIYEKYNFIDEYKGNINKFWEMEM